MRESDFLQSVVSQALMVQDQGKFEGNTSDAVGFSTENDSYVESMVSTFFSKVETKHEAEENIENSPRQAAPQQEIIDDQNILVIDRIRVYTVEETVQGECEGTQSEVLDTSVQCIAHSIDDLIAIAQTYSLAEEIDRDSLLHLDENTIFMRAVQNQAGDYLTWQDDKDFIDAWFRDASMRLKTTNIWLTAKLYSKVSAPSDLIKAIS